MTELKGQINSDERFVRWQTVLLNHLTFLNNLLLTISIGVVGFLLSLLKDPSFNPVCCEKFFFTSGVILTFLSILFGIATGFCRLIDFRGTVNKIKKELIGDSFSEIADLKERIGLYSKFTWWLFYFQSGFLIFGIMSLLGAFSLIFKEKLF